MSIVDQTVIGIKPANYICGVGTIFPLLLPLDLSMEKLLVQHKSAGG